MENIKFLSIQKSVMFFILIHLTGCNQSSVTKQHKETVFEMTPVRYHLSLERKTAMMILVFGDANSEPQKMTENLDLFLSCQPLETDDKGVISCKLTFDTIQAKKVDFIQTGRSTDSAMGLTGKSFTVSVTNDGIIFSPQLEQELKILSNNSFEDIKRPGVRLKYSGLI